MVYYRYNGKADMWNDEPIIYNLTVYDSGLRQPMGFIDFKNINKKEKQVEKSFEGVSHKLHVHGSTAWNYYYHW